MLSSVEISIPNQIPMLFIILLINLNQIEIECTLLMSSDLIKWLSSIKPSKKLKLNGKVPMIHIQNIRITQKRYINYSIQLVLRMY